MFTNYLKIAMRNIFRHKSFSLINIAGLAVGMGCCLLIFLYVQSELSYDRFHEKADRIYGLVNDVRFPTGVTKTAYTSAFPGPTMAEAFPEITSMTRLARARESFVFIHQTQLFEERNLLYADSTLLEIFSFPLVWGNPQTALKAPFSLVLKQSTARKYFGDANPLGQVLTANDNQSYTVTGVLADLPKNSHLQFDGLISMATAQQTGTFYFQDRLDLRFATYFLLRAGVEKAALEAKFPDYVERLIGDLQRANNFFYQFRLVPLADMYLNSEYCGNGLRGSWTNVVTFSAIALFTLAIACINFMNLATARSLLRAREVGVRKAIGAQRLQVAWQFLGESTLLCLIALAAAVFTAWLFLPIFNALSGNALEMTALLAPSYVLGLLGVGIVVGILAGIYPALALSRFNPVAVLKGRFISSAHGARLRQGLVVLQFAISVILIVGTAIVYKQIHFMQQQNPGFRTEQMLVVNFKGDKNVRQQIDAIKTELRKIPGVAGATASWMVPGAGRPEALARVEVPDGTRREIMMPVYPVDTDFLPLYNLQIIAGRNFSPDFATDAKEAFIVNETAVRELGYAAPQEIVGKSFYEWGQEGRVIGVVKDFHYTSLHEKIRPMNFLLGSIPDYLTLRLSGENLQQTMAEVESAWQRLAPQRPFDYRFLDEAFGAQYRAEQRFNRIVGSFSLLAIFIACLGLFGLASFAAERRIKEIGIRKVLGATVPNVIGLLSKDFVTLVLLANLLAWPVAWYAMQNWLQNFAYRVDIGWWVFVLAGGLAFVIALLTVSAQAIRAALANPVEALRYE
jgi:putative ABC transport system permease protein